MIRKFNLTNGVSVVITEELAAKYELDAALNDADFITILAAIVGAQEKLPLHPYQQEIIDKIEADDDRRGLTKFLKANPNL